MILLARTTPLEEVKKPSEGLSLFFIDFDKTAPGLDLRKIKKMGGRSVDANEVFFDNYRIPTDSLIGKEGDGFKIVGHSRYLISFMFQPLSGLTVDVGPAWYECRTLPVGW